jgi:putative transposase
VFDRDRLTQMFLIVQPATVLGWHCRLVARYWTRPARRKPRRPLTSREIRRFVLRLDSENPTWRYRRVYGELHRLGHKIAASTVWKILREAPPHLVNSTRCDGLINEYRHAADQPGRCLTVPPSLR